MNDTTDASLIRVAEQANAPAVSPISVDRIAELYNGEIFTSEAAESARQRIHWMCSEVSGNTALDVGCSQGIATVLLAREGVKVTGLDSHPEAMAYARGMSARETPAVQSRITWIEGDFWDFPTSEKFDTILLGEVIEHQAAPTRFLAKVGQHLARQGRIILTTPFGLHPHEDHKVSLFPADLSRTAHECGLSVTQLDVTDGYMRTVLVATQDRPDVPDAATLLALTVKGALAAQTSLFARLQDSSEKLRKKTDAAKLLQKRAETAEKAASAAKAELQTRLADAKSLHRTELEAAKTARANLDSQLNEQVKQHAAEIKHLKKEVAARIAELEALRLSAAAELAAARDEHAKAITKLKQDHGKAITSLRRASVLERHAAQEQIKKQLTYRWGQVLLSVRGHPMRAIALPLHLYRTFREFRGERHDPYETARPARQPAAIADGVAKESIGRKARRMVAETSRLVGAPISADHLLTLARTQGVEAAVEALQRSTEHLARDDRAHALLKASRAVNTAGNEAMVFSIACAAAEHNRAEPTLRALFWAAQKARRFDVACDTILELEQLLGPNPPEVLKARLDRLRISPANQLRVLKLIEPPAPPRIDVIPRRVCYVLHNSLPYSSGGYGTRSHGVAGGLKQAGFDVIVLTRPGFPLDIKPDLAPSDVPDLDVIDGIQYVRTLEPMRSGKTLLEYVTASADAIEARLRELKPELVIAASNHVTALPALIAARRLGLHFIYEVRGLWEVTRLSRENEFEATPAFAVQKLLETSVAKCADHVFTLTEPMREELMARGVMSEKIDLLPNSCDPERFVPRPRDDALAQRLGVPPGVPVIGYIGTFVDYEGLEDLASACAILKSRGLEFRLVLVGNENASGQERGPITEAIASIASEHKFTDWLIMPGRVPHEEVESYYSLLDVCPFPRKPWPVCEMVSPMKPLEALAMEKAVVVSSVRALTEIIHADRTGAVFEKGNVDSLADVLQHLIADPSLRDTLGRNGREWVKAERTWRRVGQMAEQILREKVISFAR